MNLLFTNVVYGEPYSTIFLEAHLKSLLDASNIPAVRDRIQYVIFSDAETIPKLKAHPNFQKLARILPQGALSLMPFEWGKSSSDPFERRYTILQQTFKTSVCLALERGTYLSALVADLVFAKDFLARIFARLDSGFDSVFVLPLRSAAEAVLLKLREFEGALPAVELFRLGYENLHPLWVACHWDAPQFTKLPFSLLWNTGTGIIARSFSITPIAFVPTEQMLIEQAIIDIEIPGLLKNPYWATDWTEAPVIGVEPLVIRDSADPNPKTCYYPPFGNLPASTYLVKEFAERNLHPSQFRYLSKSLYYPDEVTVAANSKLKSRIHEIALRITGRMK